MVEDTREKILEAAREVFVEKGVAGARMQEIADRADVNKAMLHYYFRSKDGLYEAVVVGTIGELFNAVFPAISDETISPKHRLKLFVEAYVRFLASRPYLPRLIMQDLMSAESQLPSLFRRAQENAGFANALPLLVLLDKAVQRGDLRQTDPVQTVISLLGMSLFYFVGKPILDTALQIPPHDDGEFIEARIKNITDILFNGLLPRSDEER